VCDILTKSHLPAGCEPCKLMRD